MVRIRRLVLLALAAMTVAVLSSLPARAASLDVAETCHAEAAAGEGYAALRRTPGRWTCNHTQYTVDADSVFVRFRLRPEGPRPAAFVTHALPVEGVRLWVADSDGAIRTSYVPEAALRHLPAGPEMTAPLPPVTARSVLVVARIDRPWGKTTISEARLDTEPGGSGWDTARLAAMAAICGMLVVPLLLNGRFYTALPRRYVIWHLAIASAILIQTLIGTGFVHFVADPPSLLEMSVQTLCYCAMAGFGMVFLADFVEADRLDPRIALLLRAGGPVVLALGVVAALPFQAMRTVAMVIVNVSIAGALVVVAAAMVDAARRGSRAVRYPIAAWSPTLAIAVYRIACNLLPGARPTEALVVYQLCLALEVVITSAGIISRLVDLRHERDSANARALLLENVAGRDALTGLANRHSIEARFAGLFAAGFRTMAVLDLDHFKAVNDGHGHAVGDEVLRATASALVEDADTCAIRLGGEEFVLLLRGVDAAERAERARRAISARIAEQVPGLDRVVTASMGLVEHDPAGALHAEFDMLYRHCDRLLYEAKRLGRNRTAREKLTGFGLAAPLVRRA